MRQLYQPDPRGKEGLKLEYQLLADLPEGGHIGQLEKHESQKHSRVE